MPAPKEKAKPQGRPSSYTVAMAEKICKLLASGNSLNTICKMEGMPHRVTVNRWLAQREAFRTMYIRAREDQADCLFDEILDIADEECTMVRADKHGSKDDDGQGNTEVVFDPTAVQRNRLRIDARKWYAAKLRPRVYGDRYTEAKADSPEVGDQPAAPEYRLAPDENVPSSPHL